MLDRCMSPIYNAYVICGYTDKKSFPVIVNITMNSSRFQHRRIEKIFPCIKIQWLPNLQMIIKHNQQMIVAKNSRLH